MRVPRIKESGEGFYHSMSRVVDRRRDPRQKANQQNPASHRPKWIAYLSPADS